MSRIKRKKAVRYFGIFLLFMIACTAISRGIYAYQMPRVETGQAAGKSISHTISASGNIEAAREMDVVVEEGIRIREVCVRAGEKVEAETVLLRLDTSDLSDLTEEVKRKIHVEEGKIEALRSSGQSDAQTAATARQRAEEELLSVRSIHRKAVSHARAAYERARKKRDEYPARAEYVSGIINKDVEYQVLMRTAQKADATQEDKDAFDMYREKLESSSVSAWEEGKKALNDDVEQKKTALDTAKTERKTAILQAKRAVDDAKKQAPTDGSTLLELQNELVQLQKKRDIYESLIERKGKIVSGQEGYVTECRVTAGDRTTDSAAVLLADGSQGWNFRAVLSEEQAGAIKAGDSVTLSFQNGKKKEEDCPVSSIQQTEEGVFEAVAKVSENEHFLGEAGSLEKTDQSGQYSCCVPLSALYSDNNRDYVLLMRETDTILGKEWRVVKRDVTVVDQNETDAALEEGALQEEDRFVAYANKALQSGDKVRLLEEDDEKE